MHLFRYLLGILFLSFCNCWKRSALIYHDDNRNVESFKKNFMRVDESGSYTGQWLFDHAIITSVNINGHDIMWGPLDGRDFTDLLEKLKSSVLKADEAITSLRSSKGSPKIPIGISIAIPYIDRGDRTITVDGTNYHLSNEEERFALVSWYVNQVQKFRLSQKFSSIVIWGMYYHCENAGDGDLSTIRYFNQKVHSYQMKTVWVPYYFADNVWTGEQLGFDVHVVQPGYSFHSPIDGGLIAGDRLYSIGKKSALMSLCYEYELRGGGYSQLEYWIAHQYLAVAQETGAWKFPQVFFVGGDYFDKISKSSEGNMWAAYQDLGNYLAGQKINNLEVKIPFGFDDYFDGGVYEKFMKFWKVPKGFGGMTSVRLDFNDEYGYWRGKVVVSVPVGMGIWTTSFTIRGGEDITSPEYQSLLVPLANKNITEGVELCIELFKESNSPWPNIFQLVAAKYEQPLISTPIFQETSSASRTNTEGPYSDSMQSHKGYSKGKLTDGKVSETWWNGGSVMGWTQIPEMMFSITVDLQDIFEISKVQVWTHTDPASSVNLPNKLNALVGYNCEPHLKGTLELGCIPSASSSRREIQSKTGDTRLISLPFEQGTRGRYVTVSGTPLGWFLLDEIIISDSEGKVIPPGKPYKVTPIPGEQKGAAYADNGQRLTDGVIFKNFIFGRGTDGFHGESDGGKGSVESVWEQPKIVQRIRVWITETQMGAGITFPGRMDIQWRNQNKEWMPAVSVIPSGSCGPAPCATLDFKGKQSVTGVRGLLNGLSWWVMITEISVE